MVFRSTCLLLLFVLFAGQLFAECKATLGEKPTIEGLRLGMSASQVNEVIRGVGKVKIKKDGHYSFFKTKLKNKKRGRFVGLRSIFLRFYDKQLYQIEFFFHENRYSNEVGQFVSKFSKENAFPADIFTIEHGYAVAQCVGFSLRADTKLNPHITMTEDAVAEKVAAEAPSPTNLLGTE